LNGFQKTLKELIEKSAGFDIKDQVILARDTSRLAVEYAYRWTVFDWVKVGVGVLGGVE